MSQFRLRPPIGPFTSRQRHSLTASLAFVALFGLGQVQAQGTLVDTCSYPKPQAKAVTFGALEGALFGHGPRGVLFSNDSGNGVCEWVPLAQRLAAKGFTALIYTYGTENPQDARSVDLAAALRALRARGVTQVTLVGASQGANLSLEAAAQPRPGVVALVTLSPEAQMLATAGDPTLPLARQLRTPTLFVTADDDPYGAGLAAPTLYRAAPARDKALLRVPGTAHGVDLLRDPGVFQKVLAFIVRPHKAAVAW